MAKKYVFAGLFIIGAGLMLTSNIQFAIGAVLATIGYSEVRKSSFTLDDLLFEKVREIVETILNSTSTETEAEK